MSLGMHCNIMAMNTANNLNAHYSDLSTSTQRLSSGLRINGAADDAAGIAIRELLRADVAVLSQGIRNANDAISMVQTADGALQVVDDLLIRMKELAEQAATGTYNSTQRLMIDSEFQSMATEIDRIGYATDFNGIHLLDGSLRDSHDGSGLNSVGAMKIHFGTANDSAEDYYYVNIDACTISSLGLGGSDNVPLLSDRIENYGQDKRYDSGIIGFAIIPQGTTNLVITLDDCGINDSFEVFTRSGEHLIGTPLYNNDWSRHRKLHI